MLVTYAPEDGTAQSWEWNPARVRVNEQVIVEKQYGASWREFVAGAKMGEAAARRVLLCHLLRREHPGLQLRDTPDFMDCELTVELGVAELEANRAEWEAAGGPARELGDVIAARFDADIAVAREREGALGKASSKNGLVPTSGR